jgi:hypothetical protein
LTGLEIDMSLPAGQQRALDAIADGICTSEPKLASMFAIFGRLSRNDLPPRREQLTADPGIRGWLTAVPSRLWAGLPGGQTEPGRRTWRRALILGQLTIAAVVLVVFMAVTAHPAGKCQTAAPGRAGPAAHATCPVLDSPRFGSLPK